MKAPDARARPESDLELVERWRGEPAPPGVLTVPDWVPIAGCVTCAALLVAELVR